MRASRGGRDVEERGVGPACLMRGLATADCPARVQTPMIVAAEVLNERAVFFESTDERHELSPGDACCFRGTAIYIRPSTD